MCSDEEIEMLQLGHKASLLPSKFQYVFSADDRNFVPEIRIRYCLNIFLSGIINMSYFAI